MSSINEVPMIMVLLSYFSRSGSWRTDKRTYGRTDGHLTIEIFEVDGLPNFLTYGAPLMRLRRTGEPLLK